MSDKSSFFAPSRVYSGVLFATRKKTMNINQQNIDLILVYEWGDSQSPVNLSLRSVILLAKSITD